jgi:hypothetical protein
MTEQRHRDRVARYRATCDAIIAECVPVDDAEIASGAHTARLFAAVDEALADAFAEAEADAIESATISLRALIKPHEPSP